MKTLPLLLLLAVFTGRAAAKEKIKLADITLEDGTALKDAVVLKVEPDGLRLEHHDGVSKVMFENLPGEVQKQFTFDLEEAEKFREERETDRATKAAGEHKARVEEIIRQRREVQERDAARGREEFYRLMESGEYSYPQLDNALKESISVLKEAGRKDLATMLEEDRKLLRERELIRPGERQRHEKDQLLDRIRDLENQVAQLNNAPPAVQVVHDTATIPIFVDRPIVIDRPVFVHPPHETPAPCPPSSHRVPSMPGIMTPYAPAQPARPFTPAVPQAPMQPRSSLPVAPSHSVAPTRVVMPSSGAQQHGAHLWKR